ncbi:MAG: hypothetical protein JW741_17355 [Sedimentisphaerales bacterium]|nr:hypothetical protein [Sedimentisphaerales bacterium]
MPEEMLHRAAPPEWVVEMHDHYGAEAGSTEDILRVLGDPKEGVDMMSEDKAKSF